jgi:DnaB-like helicase C terminal domain
LPTSLPSMVDAEKEFANHLTVDESVEFILKDGVAMELLYNPRIKSIYQFVSGHFSSTGKIPNRAVIQTEYPKWEFEDPQTAIQWVVDKLRERYQRNKVEELTTELATRAEDPDAAMIYLRDKVMDLERTSMSTASIFAPGDHHIFIRELKEDIIQGMHQGVSFGFHEIDTFTGGLKPGNVAYLMARPKRQKTWFLLQSFVEQVKLGNKPYLSTLELTRKEIVARLTCLISGFAWDKMQRGDLMPADYKLFDESWAKFDAMGEYWIEMPPLDERTVSSFLLKADKVGAESILLSQFKYIKGTKEFYGNEHSEYAEIAVDLKRAATRPGSERPFYVEAQFNRGGDTMEEIGDFNAGKVGLTDMIPQSADILFGLFSNKDLRENQQTEFGILDSRNTDKTAWYMFSEFRKYTEINLLNEKQ